MMLHSSLVPEAVATAPRCPECGEPMLLGYFPTTDRERYYCDVCGTFGPINEPSYDEVGYDD
jgi:predicted RNA-binding Zn-ribbon protein involved in translation (DUF1610 family)